jgi:hypothetical protein
MNKSVAVAAVGAAMVVGVSASAHSAIVVTSASDGQDRMIRRGGVIRVGSSVYLHTNSTHASVGLTRTQIVNGCYLRVFFDTATGEKILSIVVEEDETLSRKGIQAGASGGSGYANIYLYRADGTPVCANNKTLGLGANLWIAVQHLAPAKVAISDLEPSTIPPPPLEPQQQSVPSIATAPVRAVPATP